MRDKRGSKGSLLFSSEFCFNIFAVLTVAVVSLGAHPCPSVTSSRRYAASYGGSHSVTCWATKLCHSDSVYSKIHHGVLNVQVAAFCRWTASDASWLRGYSNWFSMAPRLHFMTCVPTQRTRTFVQNRYMNCLSHQCTSHESYLIAECMCSNIYLHSYTCIYMHVYMMYM